MGWAFFLRLSSTVSTYSATFPTGPPPKKKYVDINGNISEDKRQSMLRYLARYVDIPFSKGQGRVPGRTLTCPLSRQGNSTENCN